MKKVVFDSYALIAFFRQEPGYELVRELLVKTGNEQVEGYITSVNVGEIYYMICRKLNTKAAEAAITAIRQWPLVIVDADLKLCMEAAAIKAGHTLSYADAFSAALTIQKRATLITGDKEFESLRGMVNFKVKYL